MKGRSGNANGTQLIQPRVNQKQNKKNKSKVQTEQKEEKREGVMPKKGGVRIGDNTDEDKWRCPTCKHLNEI